MESTYNENSEGLAIVRVLAAVLDRLVAVNAPLALTDPGQITKFHAMKAPGIGIYQYLERIHKYASCSNESYILALIYIDRLIQRNNFLLTELNVHRVIVTSVLLAAKFFDDAYYNNAYYAKIGGVLVSEMNGLEVDFLFRINFSLHVTPDEFDKYKAELLTHSRNNNSAPVAANAIQAPVMNTMMTQTITAPPPHISTMHQQQQHQQMYAMNQQSLQQQQQYAGNDQMGMHHQQQYHHLSCDTSMQQNSQFVLDVPQITPSPPIGAAMAEQIACMSQNNDLFNSMQVAFMRGDSVQDPHTVAANFMPLQRANSMPAVQQQQQQQQQKAVAPNVYFQSHHHSLPVSRCSYDLAAAMMMNYQQQQQEYGLCINDQYNAYLENVSYQQIMNDSSGSNNQGGDQDTAFILRDAAHQFLAGHVVAGLSGIL